MIVKSKGVSITSNQLPCPLQPYSNIPQ